MFKWLTASDVSDDTDNNDKSVVTLSCDGECNIRHCMDGAMEADNGL